MQLLKIKQFLVSYFLSPADKLRSFVFKPVIKHVMIQPLVTTQRLWIYTM
uniref:Uncharacterized protein n=1 Tax=Anguilla anguilla TaxID=7936 RepID=A0A0E9SVI2_ANGAN